jgi:hypothetical protein
MVIVQVEVYVPGLPSAGTVSWSGKLSVWDPVPDSSLKKVAAVGAVEPAGMTNG